MSKQTATQRASQEGGLPGVIASALPVVLVVGWLVWLAKPWRRSRLPRARVIEPNRDSEEP